MESRINDVGRFDNFALSLFNFVFRTMELHESHRKVFLKMLCFFRHTLHDMNSSVGGLVGLMKFSQMPLVLVIFSSNGTFLIGLSVRFMVIVLFEFATSSWLRFASFLHF